jgi:predicted AlkP superfamily pyrophosphatase or phosphodiesterase
MRKLLVLNVAALGYDLLKDHGITQLAGLPLQPLTTVFPAVTCTAQATLRTASAPEAHQMTANGVFLPETRQVLFWNQSAHLVKGKRIWEDFRAQGGRVGMYFFQQSLGESVDEVVSPAPIHTHGGGLIMATYTQPPALLKGANPAQLWRYWGPLASPKVGRGIVRALSERITRGDAPELLFVYLPTLDYDLQRYGTSHRKIPANVREVVAQIEQLATVARQQGYECFICGDYAITDTPGTVIYPNRALRDCGLFQTRTIRRMLYPDFYRSAAFALCDHQVAYLHLLDESVRETAVKALTQLKGIASIAPTQDPSILCLTAEAGYWFAYPWWEKPHEAPDYATHVDIHNKPGFDPCELFFGKTPFSCSTQAERIRGTHGRIDHPVACATTLNLPMTTLQEAAAQIQAWLSC